MVVTQCCHLLRAWGPGLLMVRGSPGQTHSSGVRRKGQEFPAPGLPISALDCGTHTHTHHPGTLEKHGDGSGVWPSAPQHPAPHPASYPRWLCRSSVSAWPSTGWAARAISGEALGVAGSRVGGGGQNLQN